MVGSTLGLSDRRGPDDPPDRGREAARAAAGDVGDREGEAVAGDRAAKA